MKEIMNQEQITVIKNLQDSIHQGNVKAGWWTDLSTGQNLAAEAFNNTRYGKALVAEKLSLVHSEVSEGVEGARKGLQDDKLPHRPMLEVELADAVIRILDLCGALKYDIAGAIAEKLQYNANREDHKIENRKAQGGKSF